MNESGVWQTLKKGMANTGWLPIRVESSSGNGFPDVHFSIPEKHGFIELKYIAEWPKREGTTTKLPLRPEQKHWIRTRGELGGNIWVFVRIEDDFFLLDWPYALDACSGWTKAQWCSSKVMHWNKRIDWELFCKVLKEGC